MTLVIWIQLHKNSNIKKLIYFHAKLLEFLNDESAVVLFCYRVNCFSYYLTPQAKEGKENGEGLLSVAI